MKPIRTWVVVADGARARIFLNEGAGRGIQECAEHASEAGKTLSRDIDADRPGRTFDSAGPGRHAMEKPTDSQRHAKRMFAAELAGKLKAARHAGTLDRLVIVAAPVTLGDLRKALSKDVLDRVHAEIAKDLTRANAAEIAAQVGTVLAV